MNGSLTQIEFGRAPLDKWIYNGHTIPQRTTQQQLIKSTSFISFI
jgi:hypothetical protein